MAFVAHSAQAVTGGADKTLHSAPASLASGSGVGVGPLHMRSFKSAVSDLAWHQFENRDFRRTVEPDGIDRPADPF